MVCKGILMFTKEERSKENLRDISKFVPRDDLKVDKIQRKKINILIRKIYK